jgi:RimJ/RimL family protein N-acetyltransferase
MYILKEKKIMLQSNRLSIIPLDCTSPDVHNMFTWHNDAEMQKYLRIGPYESEQDFAQWCVRVSKAPQKVFVSKLKNDSQSEVVCCCRVVGDCIMWFSNPKYRGCGYTSETVLAVIEALALPEMRTQIDSCNVASQKIAEKAGFVYVSTRYIGADKLIYQYVRK